MAGKKKNSTDKKKSRDEVMLAHLSKPFNCGAHKSAKDYQRHNEKQQLQKDIIEDNF